MPFEEWLRKCDILVSNEFGLGLFDLEDWDWSSAHEDEFTPEEAVELFKEEIGIAY